MSAYIRKNNRDFDFKEYIDRLEERWREERRESEARLAVDRKEAEMPLTADRKEAAEMHRIERERLSAERKDFINKITEERRDFDKKFAEERKEARATRNWLIATFVSVIIGFGGILMAILATNGYRLF